MVTKVEHWVGAAPCGMVLALGKLFFRRVTRMDAGVHCAHVLKSELFLTNRKASVCLGSRKGGKKGMQAGKAQGL